MTAEELDQKLYHMICEMVDTRGIPPTRREITTVFGWLSPSSAQAAVNRLKDQGLITVEEGVARGIRVVATVMKASVEPL